MTLYVLHRIKIYKLQVGKKFSAKNLEEIQIETTYVDQKQSWQKPDIINIGIYCVQSSPSSFAFHSC